MRHPKRSVRRTREAPRAAAEGSRLGRAAGAAGFSNGGGQRKLLEGAIWGERGGEAGRADTRSDGEVHRGRKSRQKWMCKQAVCLVCQ